MSTNEEIAIKQHLSKPRPYMSPCGCMGPVGGEPLCPCAMKWCEQVDGEWYQISEDRGPDGITLKASKLSGAK